ncbi:MAG: hypothetical protein M3082_11595 [Candidatus Dormibacteraeota bacterium]|nr:hypothetical protein [Candidatus Dormibacteraeota bacterium]
MRIDGNRLNTSVEYGLIWDAIDSAGGQAFAGPGTWIAHDFVCASDRVGVLST